MPAVHRSGGVWWTEEVDGARLREAARSLGERHDALRTVFRAEDGMLVPVVLDRCEPVVVELAAEDGSDEGILRLAAEFAEGGFDPPGALEKHGRQRPAGDRLDHPTPRGARAGRKALHDEPGIHPWQSRHHLRHRRPARRHPDLTAGGANAGHQALTGIGDARQPGVADQPHT